MHTLAQEIKSKLMQRGYQVKKGENRRNNSSRIEIKNQSSEELVNIIHLKFQTHADFVRNLGKPWFILFDLSQTHLFWSHRKSSDRSVEILECDSDFSIEYYF